MRHVISTALRANTDPHATRQCRHEVARGRRQVYIRWAATAVVASSVHATDRRARKSSLIADPLAPALASQALAHRSLAPHSPAATRVQVVRAVRLESLQGDRTGWFVGWCRVVSLGSGLRWTQKGDQPIDRSSHLRASTSTVTDAAVVGAPLLSSLNERHVIVIVSRSRDAARAARDLSGERAWGARAALTADPLALQQRGERAAEPQPRRRRGRRACARRR